MAGQEFEICQAEKFPIELGRMPKKVQNAYSKRIISTLKTKPHISEPPKVKRLSGYKELWRLRVSDDYRLIYRLNTSKMTVTMLMIDHRSKIYDRLGRDQNGQPGIRIIVNAEELIEKQANSNVH